MESKVHLGPMIMESGGGDRCCLTEHLIRERVYGVKRLFDVS